MPNDLETPPSKPPLIENVFFDIGDVLMKIDFEEALKVLGPTKKNIFAETHGSDLLIQYEKGQIDSDFFFNTLKSNFSLPHDLKHIEKSWCAMVAGEIPGVKSTLERFAGKARFWTLSNTNESHFKNCIEPSSLYHGFEQILTSFQLKSYKPEPEIYKLALEKADAKPKNCLFLDDKAENIQAARDAGINAHRVYRSSQALDHFLHAYLS